MSKANEYLHSLKQVSSVNEAKKYEGEDVLLCPEHVKFFFRDDNLVETVGLGEKRDKKIRDLIRIIEVQDPLRIKYNLTNILSPLMYVESVENIPWHLNTQGILVTTATEQMISWIKKEIQTCKYGKHEFDCFWLPFSKKVEDVKLGEAICIFNRRVAGWDGSHDRPVIELLGAGGHVPTVWNNKLNVFEQLDFKENFKKEFLEELGLQIDENNVEIFGGYTNDITHELVVLCGIELMLEDIIQIQQYAVKNIDEDTMGIYMGTFNEVIDYYRLNPEPFAGGKKSAPYNFPNRKELMDRAFKYFGIK